MSTLNQLYYSSVLYIEVSHGIVMSYFPLYSYKILAIATDHMSGLVTSSYKMSQNMFFKIFSNTCTITITQCSSCIL